MTSFIREYILIVDICSSDSNINNVVCMRYNRAPANAGELKVLLINSLLEENEKKPIIFVTFNEPTVEGRRFSVSQKDDKTLILCCNACKERGSVCAEEDTIYRILEYLKIDVYELIDIVNSLG